MGEVPVHHKSIGGNKGIRTGTIEKVDIDLE